MPGSHPPHTTPFGHHPAAPGCRPPRSPGPPGAAPAGFSTASRGAGAPSGDLGRRAVGGGQGILTPHSAQAALLSLLTCPFLELPGHASRSCSLQLPWCRTPCCSHPTTVMCWGGWGVCEVGGRGLRLEEHDAHALAPTLGQINRSCDHIQHVPTARSTPPTPAPLCWAVHLP